MYLSRHLVTLLSRFSLAPSQRNAFRAGLIGTLLALAVPAQAQEASSARWVSDTLTTYVRSGPTDGVKNIRIA